MTQAHSALYDKISKLPIEKLGKAISFINYLEQEPETDLYIDPVEEAELREILATEDGITSSEMLAMIMELPDD